MQEYIEQNPYLETFHQMFVDFLTEYVQPSCCYNTFLMRHRDDIIEQYLDGEFKEYPAPNVEDYFKPETIKTFLKFFETEVKDMEEDESNFVLTYDEDKVNECISKLNSIFKLVNKFCHQQQK